MVKIKLFVLIKCQQCGPFETKFNFMVPYAEEQNQKNTLFDVSFVFSMYPTYYIL